MEITTTHIILATCGFFGTVIVGIVGFGVSRIFNKLDQISIRFEEIAEAFRKIYIDIHLADDKIWAQIGSMDKRLVRLETICERRKVEFSPKEGSE